MRNEYCKFCWIEQVWVILDIFQDIPCSQDEPGEEYELLIKREVPITTKADSPKRKVTSI